MRLIALRVVFTTAGLLSVMCRRTAVFKPYRQVSTTQGTVRGYLTPTHATFFGIPYARSPTRTDRFKAPEPPPTWDGIFEASHKIKCPQPDQDSDENCLVINVFAPRQNTLLPVYVLVHDGEFRSGWGTFEPPSRFIREGFVVVTFNYRLGALGFLCLGIPDALGNAGLKDQIAALYWVHRNIENFGGNPDEVIVHGVGSAAVSLQLLLLSGLVDELIHKVIMEYSAVLSPLSLNLDHLEIAYQGAVSIGYEGTYQVQELYKFYAEASWKQLINIPNSFLPCIEDEAHTHRLIDFDLIDKLKDGTYHKVPIMITYTNTIHDNDSNNTENLNKLTKNNVVDLLPNNLEFDNYEIKQKVGEIVREFYFGHDILETEDIEQRYLDYNYDIFVEYPVVKLAVLYAAQSPHMVYLMKFILDGETSQDDSSVISFGTILDNLYRDRDENDVILERLTSLWINFIKMGDPTPLTTSLIPIIWQPVVTDKGDRGALATVPTLQFSTKLRMSPPPENQRLLFWDKIYSKFYKPQIIKNEKSDDLDDND